MANARANRRITDIGLDHPNILTPDFLHDYQTLSCILKTPKYLTCVEFDGQPFDIIDPLKGFVRDVIKCVGYAHSVGVTHGFIDEDSVFVKSTGDICKIGFSLSGGLFQCLDWYSVAKLIQHILKAHITFHSIPKSVIFASELKSLVPFINERALHMSIDELLWHPATWKLEDKFTFLVEMAKRVDLLDGYAHFLDNQAPHSLRSMLGKDWRTVVNPSIYQALEPNFTYSETPSSLILYLRNCVEYLNSEKYIGSDSGISYMLERCFRCDYPLLFVELVKADDAFFAANENVQHLKKFGRPYVGLM